MSQCQLRVFWKENALASILGIFWSYFEQYIKAMLGPVDGPEEKAHNLFQLRGANVGKIP